MLKKTLICLGIWILLIPIVSANGTTLGYEYGLIDMFGNVILGSFFIMILFLINLASNHMFITLFNRILDNVEDISGIVKYTMINFVAEALLIFPAIAIVMSLYLTTYEPGLIMGSPLDYLFIPHGIMSFFVIYFNFNHCFGKHPRNAVAMAIATNPGVWWLIIGSVL